MAGCLLAAAVAAATFLAGIGWSLAAIAGRADARAGAMLRDQWAAEDGRRLRLVADDDVAAP